MRKSSGSRVIDPGHTILAFAVFVFSTLIEGVAGGGERLPIVWIFLLLLNLSDRRGPAALGRGEVRTSAGSNYVIKSGSQRTEVAARRRKRLPS